MNKIDDTAFSEMKDLARAADVLFWKDGDTISLHTRARLSRSDDGRIVLADRGMIMCRGTDPEAARAYLIAGAAAFQARAEDVNARFQTT